MWCESRGNLMHQIRVIWEEVLLDCSERISKCTQSMEDRNLESTHLWHLRVHMQRIDIITKPVDKCLVYRNFVLWDEVGLSLGCIGIACIHNSLMTMTTKTYNKEAGSHSWLKLTCLCLTNLSIKDQQASFSFVLEIFNLLLDDVLCIWLEWLLNNNTFFPVKQSHRIEVWHCWYSGEISLGKIATMRYGYSVCWKWLEIIWKLISMFEMLCVLAVLLKSNS